MAQEQTDLAPSSAAHFSVMCVPPSPQPPTLEQAFFPSKTLTSPSDFISVQTTLYSSSLHKIPLAPLPSFDPNRSRSASTMDHAFPSSTVTHIPVLARADSSDGKGGGGIVPSIPSTFKGLPHPATLSDNLFDELDSSRGTSWQFELHQR